MDMGILCRSELLSMTGGADFPGFCFTKSIFTDNPQKHPVINETVEHNAGNSLFRTCDCFQLFDKIDSSPAKIFRFS